MSGTSSSKTMDRMPAGSMASTEKKSEGKGALQQTMAISTESSALREQRTGLASDDIDAPASPRERQGLRQSLLEDLVSIVAGLQ
ncbi:hypothetical protein PCANC_08058 [Puccinia coronata f. sp. avenae]|uniref:Uncharacterized protein n=1 Tax=Puccinia coronata f. sp. avenae TaxID=200324 RepID=A0A2N5VIT9_9BASI|nr:hypothetical protein PCASD_14980 [Puccinia coronata f. sp. avenae]PLW18400.1 hypothetical protein PCANC_08842 [Puccinia coronata f. sp. avenae]PLW45720.1 hypothetical protein PCANC_08058 [Puccinia coronata f. sp. avenae]PLW49919.1 hypothetical protein PCASD_01296 [Puccinia coronata f. sp. avenae]